MEYSFHALRQLAHPKKAQIVVHLAEHPGDAPDEVSEHLERPLSSVYRYLAELELAGFVLPTEREGTRRYHLVPFRLVLDPEALRDMLRSPVDLPGLYRASLGKRGWDRIMGIAERARKGKITLRQAASRSGLPYREFISLYESLEPLVARAKAFPGR